jgi:pilus assembly protein CpaB
VDVVATVRAAAGNAVSRVLLANVPVLTAGTRYDQQQTEQSKPIPSTVVTLMVTPAQAERIALASTEGNITLMLRNPLDVSEPPTPGAQLARLTEVDGPPAPPAPPRVTPAPRPQAVVLPVSTTGHTEPAPRAIYTVEAIRAGKRTQERVE